MVNTTYTFKEVCKKAGVPYSTGRFYRDRHPDFMYSVSTGRNKRYTEQTIEVLHFIGNAYKSGASANEVQDRLSESYPINHDAVPSVPQCSVTMQDDPNNSLNNAIAPLALMVTRQQAQYHKDLTEILQKIANRDEEIQKVQKDNAILKKRLARLEAEMNKPWWKKIF